MEGRIGKIAKEAALMVGSQVFALGIFVLVCLCVTPCQTIVMLER